MATQNTATDLVSQAWNQLRTGRADAAVTEFQKIVQQYPKDIDANYGLGLAQRATHHDEAAYQTFQKTLELVEESKNTYESERVPNPETDAIKTPEDDRFMMLKRMVSQRLSELKGQA